MAGPGAPRREPECRRGGDPRWDRRRPVPVHRLREDRRGDRGDPRRAPRGCRQWLARRCSGPRSRRGDSRRRRGRRVATREGRRTAAGARDRPLRCRPPATDYLAVRAVRSPHARARFEIGDLAPLRRRHPGLVDILTAADVPGQNRYGVYATGKDQPALADGVVRHRGEAILAPRRRRGDRRHDHRRRAADHLAAAAARSRPRRRARRRRPEPPRRLAGQRPHPGPPRPRRRRCRARELPRDRPGRGRDDLRRARVHRARGGFRASGRRPDRADGQHAGAVHGPRRGRADPRHPARGRPHHPDRVRRRLRREARPRRPRADRDRGVAHGPAGAGRLDAPGIDGRQPEAPSVADQRHRGRRRRRPAHRLPLPRRLRHRRLCLVGPDGRQSRARCTRWARTPSTPSRPPPAPSTPTTHPPGPSAASGCRRPRSPTRR